MKGSPVKLAIACSLLAAAALSLADAPLKVGSPAPELKVAKWIKGEPVKKYAPGKVYVVEFWATWCGPCKTSIPHLTELAKKYKDKAIFTGVSVFEERAPKDESYISKVETFVTEWGPKMDYNVAVDGKDGWMGKNWMEAAEQGGIPTAFVVDQKGTVVWIGHPMVGLDKVVGEVIEGKFDMAAEAARVAKEKAEAAKAMAEFKPFIDAMNAKDYKTAVIEADKVFAANPAAEQRFAMAKFTALSNTDSAAATAYARKLASGIYKDNGMALNSLAWSMVDDETVMKTPDVKAAIEIAERGVALLKPGMDMEGAYILDTLAYAYFKDGQLDKAIATQEKALASASRVADFDSATLTEIKDRLAKFKAKKG